MTETLISLQTLGNRTGTDKGWIHHYLEHYEWHFGSLRDKPIKLLEIGVGGYNRPNRGGGSLKMWSQYFTKGEIIGIDIEDKSFLDNGNIKTYVCDQTDEDALHSLSAARGPFNIIIDDGSHNQPDVLKSFYTLFPLLADGGIYVIEDLECCYKPSYKGHPRLETDNAIGLVQRLIDGLHWSFWNERKTGPTIYDRMVKSIHVSKELVFIYKK